MKCTINCTIFSLSLASPIQASFLLHWFASTTPCRENEELRFLIDLMKKMNREVATISGILAPPVRQQSGHASQAFDLMLKRSPFPSIDFLNILLSSPARRERHSTVISMFSKIDQLGPRTITPDLRTLNIVIHSLCHLNRPDLGFSLLAKMLKLGLEPNSETITSLITGLSFDGKLNDALHMFDELLERGLLPDDTLTYNTIIEILCKMGNTVTIVGMLKKLETTSGYEVFAGNLFDSMLEMRPLPSIIQFNQLLASLARTKHYSTVIALFSMMDQLGPQTLAPDLHTLNIVIDIFCHLNHADLGFSLLAKMLKLGLKPNYETTASLITGLFFDGKPTDALQMFGELLERGLSDDSVSYNTLIERLCKMGNTATVVQMLKKLEATCEHKVFAWVLFDSMLEMRPLPSILEFNQLFASLARTKHYASVISLFSRMQQLGTQIIKPNVRTLNIVINGLCKEGMVEEAFKVIDAMTNRGISPDVITYNILIQGYCKSRRIDEAIALFKEMPKKRLLPDTVTYSSLISGFCKAGRIGDAILLLDEMKSQDQVPNLRTYKILFDALCKNQQLDQVLALFNNLENSGMVLDIAIYRVMLDCMLKSGQLIEAMKIFTNLFSKGLRPDCHMYNTVINGLCEEQLIEKAWEVFQILLAEGCVPNVVTYNMMIKGYSKSGRMDEAMALFKEMPRKQLNPDVITYNTLIGGFCKAGRLKDAFRFFDEMNAEGQIPNHTTYSTLLQGLCRSKQLDVALALFKKLENLGPVLDIVLYNVMLNGMCEGGKLTCAIELFLDLRAKGLKPSVYSYNIMMKGLCKERLVDEAYELLQKMEEEGLLPNYYSYNTVAQSYLKNNETLKASRVLDIMKCRGISAYP